MPIRVGAEAKVQENTDGPDESRTIGRSSAGLLDQGGKGNRNEHAKKWAEKATQNAVDEMYVDAAQYGYCWH